MTKSDRLQKIEELLIRDYPVVTTPLYHQSAFQLLCATMLSAQTLDATTNKVAPTLFKKYPSIQDLANANPEDISKIIRIVNYNKTKSMHLVEMAKKLISDFDRKVPHTIDELTTLPGVGRKTANVVISEWFAKTITERGNWPEDLGSLGIPNATPPEPQVLPEGFVVDTHVIRTANRLGLSKSKDPKKIEQDLMELFPRDQWNDWSLRLIFHGRYRCKAQKPQCYLDPEWRKICGCVSTINLKS